MARPQRTRATSRRLGKNEHPPSHLIARHHRDVTGLSVSYPDWNPAKVRRNSVAVVLHLADAEAVEPYLALLAARGAVDAFVVLPDEEAAMGVAVPESSQIRLEVLGADPIGDGLYQLTSLVNSGRLTGYRVVIRHSDDGPDAVSRFAELIGDESFESLDRSIHRDLGVAGVAMGTTPIPRASEADDISDRIGFVLLRASTRRSPKSESAPLRSLSTFALRGSVLESLGTLRVDHQDFYFTYNHYVNEGLASESLGGTEPDPAVPVAIAQALFALIENSGLRVVESADDLASLENPHARTGLTRRAHAYAVYHPELTSPRPERDASWTHIVSTSSMYLGQSLPIAPTTLKFADPLSPADRVDQATLAAEHGIDGFLVLGSWGVNGLSPEPFFESLSAGEKFPWALVLQHSTLKRTDPAGTFARTSAWIDPGVSAYSAIAQRIAGLVIQPSYLRLKGRPIIVLDDVEMLFDASEFVLSLRAAVVAAAGVEPWLLMAETYRTTGRPGEQGVPEGFDGIIQLSAAAYHDRFSTRLDGRINGFAGRAFNMRATMHATDAQIDAHVDDRVIPGAIVGLDTTPVLRSQGTVGYNWNVMSFRKMLDSAVSSVAYRDDELRIVAIDSWNGWAELSQLEPGRFTGSAYLSAVKDTLFY